jgi:1-phosphofructokinase
MGVITELNESGSEISAADIGKVAGKITDELKEGDVAVLTGSLPAGCEKDVYAKLIAALNKKNVKCVLDADGEALVLGVKEKPYFIKPNIDELSVLLGQKIEDTREALVAAGSRLLAQGISVVGISLGGKGSFLMDQEKALFAQAQKVRVESTVGAGDSMVAGIISRLDKSLEEMLRAGVAAATGSVTQEGTNLCTAEIFKQYYSGIQISEV